MRVGCSDLGKVLATEPAAKVTLGKPGARVTNFAIPDGDFHRVSLRSISR